MRSEWELIEDYIDYMGDRELVEKLNVEEQVLWRFQTKDTLSFTLFALGKRIEEFIDILFRRGRTE